MKFKFSPAAKIIGICYVGWLFDFYDLALFSFILVQVGQTFNLNSSQEAWLLGLALGFSGVGGILFGYLADRLGRKTIMTWTVLLYSLGTGLSAFAPNFTTFAILRAITGLGIGGEWAVAHALVAESVDIKKRGRAAALLQSGEPAGVALAAIVGLLIAPKIGWRWVLGLSSLTALWVVTIRTHLPESKLWTQKRFSKEALKWLLTLRGAWTWVRAFLLSTFKLGSYWSTYVWLPKFFLIRFHEPLGRSALWFLTAQFGQFLGMIGFGYTADRVGRRMSFTLYSLLTAGALAVLAFRWTDLLQNRIAFWTTLFLLGVGSGCTAGFGALLAELFPTSIRNLAMGSTYNVAKGVQVFAPVVVAMAFTRWDVSGALSVPLILALLTGIWVWTLPETAGRDLSHVG